VSSETFDVTPGREGAACARSARDRVDEDTPACEDPLVILDRILDFFRNGPRNGGSGTAVEYEGGNTRPDTEIGNTGGNTRPDGTGGYEGRNRAPDHAAIDPADEEHRDRRSTEDPEFGGRSSGGSGSSGGGWTRENANGDF
jgi:hypothetical protein